MPAYLERRIVFCINSQLSWSPVSSVSIVTRLRTESQGNLGSILGKGRVFLLSYASRPALGPTMPPVQCTLRVKWPKREVCSAENKNAWKYNSSPSPYAFRGLMKVATERHVEPVSSCAEVQPERPAVTLQVTRASICRVYCYAEHACTRLSYLYFMGIGRRTNTFQPSEA
jgi:hypothetical protein